MEPLKIDIDGIILRFAVSEYRHSTRENWEDEWCKIDLLLESKPWINYKIDHDEMLACCEIDKLSAAFSDFLDGKIGQKQDISFIEPDIEFTLYPGHLSPYAEMRVHFWNEGFLTENYLVLTLSNEEIRSFNMYLQSVISGNII